ncbi:hypothetical protein [Arthrobacter sp. ATA002]|uniref:hypothetical protein n=1 Tax=Arthrobacter sp. ATA002 TaxID=2991715 RepID=UPI002E32E80E|nr:hypothetical protein [Arthrobacter sp. ATA002]
MDLPAEMFRPGDLDAVPGGQRRAGGARADGLLGPVRSGDKEHALGPAAEFAVALHPEQPAQLIAHGHQQAAVRNRAHQQLPNDGHDGRKGMCPPVVLELRTSEDEFRHRLVRIRVVAQRPLPGIPDRSPQPALEPISGAQAFMRPAGGALESVRGTLRR